MTLEAKIDSLIQETVKQTKVLERIVRLLEAEKRQNEQRKGNLLQKSRQLQRENLRANTSNQPFQTEESKPEPQYEQFSPETVEKVLQRLSFRDREIVKLRNAIADGYPYTLPEVANMLKITRERIRQIEVRAVQKLSKITNLPVEQVIDVLRTCAQISHATWLKKESENIPNMLVSNLSMSNRIKKCLESLGVATVGELVEKTPDELLKIKNMGLASLDEIREELTQLGLSLRDDQDSHQLSNKYEIPDT
jgi:DNA-directed RNA polymerase alpha subunit